MLQVSSVYPMHTFINGTHVFVCMCVQFEMIIPYLTIVAQVEQVYSAYSLARR